MTAPNDLVRLTPLSHARRGAATRCDAQAHVPLGARSWIEERRPHAPDPAWLDVRARKTTGSRLGQCKSPAARADIFFCIQGRADRYAGGHSRNGGPHACANARVRFFEVTGQAERMRSQAQAAIARWDEWGIRDRRRGPTTPLASGPNAGVEIPPEAGFTYWPGSETKKEGHIKYSIPKFAILVTKSSVAHATTLPRHDLQTRMVDR